MSTDTESDHGKKKNQGVGANIKPTHLLQRRHHVLEQLVDAVLLVREAQSRLIDHLQAKDHAAVPKDDGRWFD